ncbi:MAG: stage II sporulation protein R [Lachnospiraceae bacterium]|nr:stage II sporulation protein R [Lachnospiraceae bacterium]
MELWGGVLVSILSYYHQHKDGGALQTMFAVLDSFNTVAEAYASSEGDTLLSGKNYTLGDQVAEAFERIEDGEEIELSNEMLQYLMSGKSGNSATAGDVLAMEGEDGGIGEGAPYSGILRFHVRANSDSKEDQELKLAVKEDVVTMLEPLLSTCHNVDESRKMIVANLQNIYTVAVSTIVEQGYDYEVKVYLTEEEFPAKTYGDLTFPAGEYQALRIDIGEAKGQNWWCVVYPPLCFIDGSTAVVSAKGKEQLKEILSPEEYEALFTAGQQDDTETTVKGESWILNWIQEHIESK